MGLGGHLIWSAVFRNIGKESRKPILVCQKPRLSDWLSGRLYNGCVSYKDDPIFVYNPRLKFTEAFYKKTNWRFIDGLFSKLFSWARLREHYERWVRKKAAQSDLIYAYLDMACYHYVEAEKPEYFIWKNGKHAIDNIVQQFGFTLTEHRCEIYFTSIEWEMRHCLWFKLGVVPPVILIEPHTKEDYFGTLRAWPFERWQELILRLRQKVDFPIVQVGLGGKPVLEGIIDATGRFSFRQTAMLMAQSRLFLGTDGGLMHLANAVGTLSVILWSGVNAPSFLGYPNLHHIVHKWVDCSPCGRKGTCPFEHRCMTAISVEDVFSACMEELREPWSMPNEPPDILPNP